MTNESKPTTSFANTARISIGESWATITTTWATETRTWADMASLIDNITKVSSSMTNTAKP